MERGNSIGFPIVIPFDKEGFSCWIQRTNWLNKGGGEEEEIGGKVYEIDLLWIDLDMWMEHLNQVSHFRNQR